VKGVGPLEREELDRLLTKNAGMAARERLTLMRLFEELQALGRCRAGSDAGYMPPLGAPWRWTERPSPSRATEQSTVLVPVLSMPGACPPHIPRRGRVAVPACSLRPAASPPPLRCHGRSSTRCFTTALDGGV
jgi:hypothetical protein